MHDRAHVRRGQRVSTSGFGPAAVALALVAAVVGAAGAVVAAEAVTAPPPEPVPVAVASPTPAPPPPRLEPERQLVDPAIWEDEVESLVVAASVPDVLPKQLRAQLDRVNSFRPAIYADDCHAPPAVTVPLPVGECTYGAPRSATTVALVGDSHAAQWFPAARLAAEHNGWRLVVMTKSGCSLYEVDVTLSGQRDYPQCRQWQRTTRQRLKKLAPDVTLVAGIAHPGHRGAADRWEQGTRSGMRKLRAAMPDTALVMLLDGPHAGDQRPIPGCLREREVTACHLRADDAFDEVQRAIADDLADGVVDTPALVCDDEGLCPVVLDRTIVYRDSNHFSIAFAMQLQRTVAEAVREGLSRRG